MQNFQETANFIWEIADEILRDDFKRGKYPDVILPFTVLRRLDCVLAPTKQAVLEKYQFCQEKNLKNPDGQLRKAAGKSFYNTSKYDFPTLLTDAKNISKNTIAYLNGFSNNMRDVIEKFNLPATIETLNSKNLLFLLIKKFSEADLSPEKIDNHRMGTIFEELIRRFNEQRNENPGEHFTPREVIRLMVRLLLRGDEAILKQPGVVRTIYDCACGSGGMLSIAKEYILTNINPSADIRLFGQEVNDETFAVCKSDMLIKGDDRDADNIKFGSSFCLDGHQDNRFDYMLVNPPYGKDWKKEKDFIDAEAAKKGNGRFEAGTPRINDGQLLFLQHLISKMKPVAEGGSKIAIVLNGSPLFTGDAGSGESEIRRWILENDWLESIVALPGQLFYNTGITTYIWVLSNRKPEYRKGKVLLVNGAATYKVKGKGKEKEVEVFAQKMRKSLGDKRNELSEIHIDKLDDLAFDFAEGVYTKVFDTSDFGYRKITIERPLRLNFQASPERIARLESQAAFVNLASSKKKGTAGETEVEAGKKLQSIIREVLSQLGEKLYKNRQEFEQVIEAAFKQAKTNTQSDRQLSLFGETSSIKLSAPVKKAILAALSEKDETADICFDDKGNPEPDPELRDYENVPLKEDIYVYFDREVKPHVPDAWINETVIDEKDKLVGKVGYELNFNRHFYEYQPLRPRKEIAEEIKVLQASLVAVFNQMAAE
ncbi:SAM-dependent DNA methyltransferase [Phormidium sp. LEGE 05292]|uniref:type I restriction-modification system subunit M n=1 Tax=[Phormidium] sp. LEGE 05292 TaxID=767427 RepID=UPI0018805A80|nr:class I SAM-dependent DNA methyltransferase [Phormidium sp. LEGE 05292]MBE9226259.1 SAM-dependent DNA methyltransferase [Phormidium sp. LEGE 05292]